MSTEWYPIIDYDKCTGCLACVKFCPHDVFTEKHKKPFVAHPENCVDMCIACIYGMLAQMIFSCHAISAETKMLMNMTRLLMK